MMNPDGVSALLTHLRTRSGRTRVEMATAVTEARGEHCDEGNVKRWETGRRLPLPHWRPAVAAAYGVPVRELDKAIDASRRERRLGRLELMDSGTGGQVQDVDRRAFLGVAALTAGAAAEPWGRLAAALDGTARVDAAAVEALSATTAGMFDSEEHVPARLMVDRLTAHLDMLTALLPGAGRYRAALAVAAGEAAALAGWMCWDMGDPEGATRYYAVAAQAGHAAGHPAVGALALGYASYAADPAAAREMLARAQEHARGPGYATAAAWLAAREAEEAAALGDREGAVRTLERARTAFSFAPADGEQAWTRFFRASRLESMAVSAYARLGHPELAAAADAALASLAGDEAKISCSVLGDAAAGYLAAGDVDQAVEVGARALEATVQHDTTMGRTRLHALAAALPSSAAADELRERIRAALPAA